LVAPGIELEREATPNEVGIRVHAVNNAIGVQVVSGTQPNVLIVDAADKVGKRALPNHVLNAAADVGAVVAVVRRTTAGPKRARRYKEVGAFKSSGRPAA